MDIRILPTFSLGQFYTSHFQRFLMPLVSYFSLFLAVRHGYSLTRDRTQALGGESVESSLLDSQGIPH